MTQEGPHAAGRDPSSRDDLRLRIEARIRAHERASANGLWGMALFLLVSLVAYNSFSILPALSPSVRTALGASPPTELISLALVVYAFSGIVRTLARMSQNLPSYFGLMHTAFFTAFYGFYHLSAALPDNFWAVFFSGMSVMGLENYFLWSSTSAAIRKERVLLDTLSRGGTPVIDEESQ